MSGVYTPTHTFFSEIHLLQPEQLQEFLDWFRDEVDAMGGGSYQTLINQALREFIQQRREPLEDTLRRVLREELQSVR